MASLTSSIQTDLGKILVNESVIAIVAGYSAIECAGIVAMASKRATDGIVELLGRDNLSRGIKVSVREENHVSVELYIIVEYGVSIAAVARNVIETVKYRLESCVGVIVDHVNVTIEGIRV